MRILLVIAISLLGLLSSLSRGGRVRSNFTSNKSTTTTKKTSHQANQYFLSGVHPHTQLYLRQTAQKKFIETTLKIINKVRTQGCSCGTLDMPAASAFTWNDTLYNAALAHAKDMSSQNYFSHISKDGRKAVDRIRQAGYNQAGYRTFVVGENIAEGQEDLKEVIDDWFKSEGHCRNLMNPKFFELGLVQAGGYWVMEFGGRTPFSATEQEQIKNGDVRVVDK